MGLLSWTRRRKLLVTPGNNLLVKGWMNNGYRASFIIYVYVIHGPALFLLKQISWTVLPLPHHEPGAVKREVFLLERILRCFMVFFVSFFFKENLLSKAKCAYPLVLCNAGRVPLCLYNTEGPDLRLSSTPPPHPLCIGSLLWEAPPTTHRLQRHEAPVGSEDKHEKHLKNHFFTQEWRDHVPDKLDEISIHLNRKRSPKDGAIYFKLLCER